MDDEIRIISRAEAKACRLLHYFTGKPCRHGHIAERYTSTGQCSTCIKKASSDRARLNPEWVRAANKRRYDKNPEKYRERFIKFRAANIDYYKSYMKDYRADEANKAHAYKLTREWRKKNPEKARNTLRVSISKWLLKDGNLEKRRLWQREHRKNNPDKYAAYRHARRAVEGKYTAEDVARIREAQKDRCAYCGAALNGQGHLDHIIPIKKGGTNFPRNLQWLCQPCNNRKSSLDPEDFVRRLGKLI